MGPSLANSLSDSLSIGKVSGRTERIRPDFGYFSDFGGVGNLESRVKWKNGKEVIRTVGSI